MAYIRRAVIKSVLYFASALVVVFLGFFFLRVQIGSASVRVDVLRSQLAAREINTQTLTNLHDEYESTIKNYSAILSNYVPRRDDLTGVVRELEVEAIRRGVNAVVTVASEELPAGDQFGYVTYSVRVTGSFSAVKNFFEGLSKYRFLTARESLLIVHQDDGIEANTIVRVYYSSL